MSSKDEQAPLWTPSAEMTGGARMTAFMEWARARHARELADYTELWEWSVQEVEQFWAGIWEYCGVRASTPYEQVLASRQMPGARWFEGAQLNYAENMLRRERDPAAPAVLHASELRPLAELSWGELTEQVAAIAAGLRALGVRRGDRVAAYMPNIPETLVAFLASASIGAIWSCAAPEFGARSVVDRFAQIEPKVLLAVDGYRHGGKDFDRVPALRAILEDLPSVQRTVMLPYLSEDADAAGLAGGITWDELLRAGDSAERGSGANARKDAAQDDASRKDAAQDDTSRKDAAQDDTSRKDAAQDDTSRKGAAQDDTARKGAAREDAAQEGASREDAGQEDASRKDAGQDDAQDDVVGQRFEQVPFDHPLWVLYSSGTTGLPKAIVHGHGGILLEQLKKSLLHLDLHRGDRMFWFTTTGWMMWNFLVGCLFSDAAIVLYDGSPGHPDLGRLWELAERARISCMGVSAGLLSSCEKAGIEPAREYDLSGLRSIGSTGSPLAPESFRWVYRHVGRDIWLFSTSGGTDVCTAFVGGCPLLPVYEGEIQCRVLGCAVESWDEQGRALQDGVSGPEGGVGELVLTEPLPSMPLFLWGDQPRSPGDPIGERYRESYFDMYPGVWRHGDWVRITARGGAVIYGRSDSTINRQGVRMGTSEIYRATGALEEVLDALVVDIPRGGPDGELWMVLFVVLREGVELDEELVGAIKRRVREDCSPRHVPNEVLRVSEVPRTLSGKVLEVPVKRILMGAAPSEAASVESLANPRSLDYFVELATRLRTGDSGSVASGPVGLDADPQT